MIKQSIQTRHLGIYLSLVKIVSGVFFLFCCSQIEVPLQPIPINLQTAGVLILALCYSRAESMGSIVSFVALGAVGVPLYSGFASGLSVMIGPTGGYLAGMVLCTYIVSTTRIVFGEDSWMKLLIYSMLGTVSVLITGISYLSLAVGIEQAMIVGLYPFIIPGMIEALFTTCVVRILK